MMKKGSNVITIFILLFFLVSVVYPIGVMLSNVEWNTFSSLVQSPAFKEAFNNSLVVTSIATIISIIIAYILAFTLNRTNIKHKGILKVLITLPMLIPSISHGLGLINLFGTNGLISKLFNFNIIGSGGIIAGSIIYSFPVAFLMLDDGFRYIDNNLYNNAKVLGMNKWQTFKKVTFYFMKKPILSSIFAVFTMIFTDYGVPLAVGGKFITLPVYLYKEVIGLLDFSKGVMIGIFLLIPAFVSFVFDNFTKNYSNNESYEKEYNIPENKTRDIVFKTITYLIIIMFLVIIGSFVFYAFIDNVVLNPVFSLKHFEYVIDNKVSKYIINSLLVSVVVSIIGTFIAFATAYLTARIKGKVSKVVHIVTISTLAVPGIVLGLSFLIGFKGTFIYNTYLILILVNIIHFIASPYLMAYNALQKINPNYEIIAKTFNINLFKTIKDIIIPCTKSTILEMISYFFVNSMITISAVTFLFNTKTMPLSLMINNYEGNLMLGEAAIISLIILFFNVLVKSVVYLINRKEEWGRNNEIIQESI